jgi:hypothetical protein
MLRKDIAEGSFYHRKEKAEMCNDLPKVSHLTNSTERLVTHPTLP